VLRPGVQVLGLAPGGGGRYLAGAFG